MRSCRFFSKFWPTLWKNCYKLIIQSLSPASPCFFSSFWLRTDTYRKWVSIFTIFRDFEFWRAVAHVGDIESFQTNVAQKLQHLANTAGRKNHFSQTLTSFFWSSLTKLPKKIISENTRFMFPLKFCISSSLLSPRLGLMLLELVLFCDSKNNSGKKSEVLDFFRFSPIFHSSLRSLTIYT